MRLEARQQHPDGVPVNRGRHRPAASLRHGFTLVELVVAITVLTVGILGFVACSAFLTRGLGGASSDTIAAVYGQSSIEELAGTACQTLPLNVVTVTTSRGITRRSRITNNGNNTLAVVDSLAWTTRGRRRVATLRTILPCRPGA